MENEETKMKRINGVMGWFSAVIIAFITALTYPIRYFWFKGIADYYKMDSIYLYGNYNKIISDALGTIAIIFFIFMAFDKLYKWVNKKQSSIYEIIGRWSVIFFILSVANAILLFFIYLKMFSLKLIFSCLIVGMIITFMNFLIFVPATYVLEIELEKTNNSKKILNINFLIGVLVWICFLFISVYQISSKQISYNKEYEIIQSEDIDKVVISKYQDMFYTYKCIINNNELTIHTSEGELIDMREVKFNRRMFEKVIIK